MKSLQMTRDSNFMFCCMLFGREMTKGAWLCRIWNMCRICKICRICKMRIICKICDISNICKNCQLSQLSIMIFCWFICIWTWYMDSRTPIAQFCFANTKLIPQAMLNMLKKLQDMFGINFWRNTILEVTLCVCWIQWKSNYLSEFPQIKLSTGNTLEPRPWV